MCLPWRQGLVCSLFKASIFLAENVHLGKPLPGRENHVFFFRANVCAEKNPVSIDVAFKTVSLKGRQAARWIGR